MSELIGSQDGWEDIVTVEDVDAYYRGEWKSPEEIEAELKYREFQEDRACREQYDWFELSRFTDPGSLFRLEKDEVDFLIKLPEDLCEQFIIDVINKIDDEIDYMDDIEDIDDSDDEERDDDEDPYSFRRDTEDQEEDADAFRKAEDDSRDRYYREPQEDLGMPMHDQHGIDQYGNYDATFDMRERDEIEAMQRDN